MRGKGSRYTQHIHTHHPPHPSSPASVAQISGQKKRQVSVEKASNFVLLKMHPSFYYLYAKSSNLFTKGNLSANN